LVAFPTVSDRPVTEIAAHLAQNAEDAGFEVQQLPSSPGKSNVVARAGPKGRGGLLLSGHMDVVPTEGQAWSSDPFRLTQRDGQLIGRGTADMKGFIAAVSTALPDLPIDRLQREVVLVWTHDEEVGCVGAQHLVEKWADTLSPLPPDTWIGEPTDLCVCHMHPGHTTLDIICTGRPAHSSRPELGLSAIHLAGEVLEVLRGVAAAWGASQGKDGPGPRPHAVMNVGHIHGGAAVNIVPEHCCLTVGIRPVPGQDEQELIRDITAGLAGLTEAAASCGGEIVLETRQSSPAMLTDPDTPLATSLRTHATDPAPRGVAFSTDGGHLSRLGTRCLIFGPGSIDLAHRPDESISAKALEQTVDIVRKVILERCT
jgi:acetylornithine deacetylase